MLSHYGGAALSTGRGGAGNIGSPKFTTQSDTSDLATPSLKKSVYTTGRGGTGNMAKNDKGPEARMAQDVVPVMRKNSKHAPISTGRGGGGNMARNVGTSVVGQEVDEKTSVQALKQRDGTSISPRGREKVRKGSLEKAAEKSREIYRRMSGGSSGSSARGRSRDK